MTKDNVILFPGKPFDKKKIITDKKEVQKISKVIRTLRGWWSLAKSRLKTFFFE